MQQIKILFTEQHSQLAAHVTDKALKSDMTVLKLCKDHGAGLTLHDGVKDEGAERAGYAVVPPLTPELLQACGQVRLVKVRLQIGQQSAVLQLLNPRLLAR